MWGLRPRIAGSAIALLLVGAVLWVVGCSRQGGLPEGPATDTTQWPSPLLVEARGREFQWHFRYAGPDGVLDTGDDLTVDKDLHLPLGADVELKLTSDDYIYFMTIPEFGLREMAAPQLFFDLEFRASPAGTLELLTDPMCSARLLHDELMGRVLIQSRQAFDEWVDQSR